MIFTVAIDGPAAAGKGTISRAVAERFGFRHLDTGLLYRAVGAKGGDPVAAARGLTADDMNRPGLRTLEAGQAASRVAALPEVRAALVAFQRRFARSEGGAVLDGRDIGTVICPEAEVKLYVTASAQVRAHRRWLEVGGDEAQVLAEVRERDARDMGRADAPLKAAEDAVVIDTSDLGIDAAVDAACTIVAARLSTEKVEAKVVYSGVGGISEADITLAKASGALLIGFNVRANPQAREIAKRDKIDIRYYSIIYKVTEDMQALMLGLVDPTYKETLIGNAQIREVFRITKAGNVAGCMVTDGMVKRGAKVRLLRDNVVIHEGTLKTLRRFKDEVREVQHGFECGMAFENYEDMKVGDVIECFDIEEVKPSL